MGHSLTDRTNAPGFVMKEELGENGRGANKESVEDGAMQVQ